MTQATEQVRHLVFFQFKPETSPEKVHEIEDAFVALAQKIDLVIGFEWNNKNLSVENLGQGYSHCFLLTFGCREDSVLYLINPDHVAFTQLVGPYVEQVMVHDFLPRVVPTHC